MSKLHRVPPSPEIMAQIYADYLRIAQGSGITFGQYLQSIGYTNPAADVHGMDDAAGMRAGHHGLELISVPDKPILGPLPIKVLLVDFPDRPGNLPVSHYQQLLFSKDSHPTGSMRDYYRELTLGKVDIRGTVHGWLRLPNNYSFYCNGESGTEWRSYPRNAPRMVEDAVSAALQANVVFEQNLNALDDGTVTALFIIHAGLGAETLHPNIRGNHIWSHKWNMRQAIEVAPNLFASTYLTVPHDCKVGVCAHELGHLAFQWEDFYDPNYGEDGKEWDGSGSWDLMAGGSYNGNGHRPCHPAALHKTQHNWITVTQVHSSGQFSLKPYTANTGEVLKIVSPKYRRGQYLLLENRAKSGFDSDLPGEGLLVWKIDESADMFAPEKPALLLVQADGRRQLETPNDWNTGDAGDPFPGSSNRTDLTDRGTISTSFPDGEDSGISLKNIQREAGSGIISLAVEFAGEQTSNTDVLQLGAEPRQAIPDNSAGGIESVIDSDRAGIVRQIAVSVDISHSYVGDLRVELIAPSGQAVTLHNRAGGNSDDLRKTWSSAAVNALVDLLGSSAKGRWRLRVTDLANADTGTLNSWGLAIELDKAESVVRAEAKPKLAIPDNDAAGIASVLRIARPGVARAIKVALDIEHTYRGDLRVELINPQGQRALLHNRSGRGEDHLKVTYDAASSEALAPLIGKPINGDWTLRVSDLAGSDVGTLNSWSLELELAARNLQASREDTTPRPIPDADAAGIGSSLNFSEQGTVQALAVEVDIEHTYIGDLRLELLAPSGQRTLLHDRAGGRTRNLLLQLSSGNSAALAALTGEPVQGNWVLRVADLEGLDTGTLRRWSLQLTYAS
ncbi:M6 family metalloprotease domain-containing protein [Pseudomaricurvus alcaniphilus]|uniref:proprotein convertase P-domain-containing protein n=1 Tax=Pseudomaricurvus alcaniphilus TaxID=1166482 RepID=UPI00140D5405|nr:proprotein convertase P-domain-containing protein [Pseudomaricurvus alcaniphilus]NHN38732.1 M6 family metalloprotease domain-containing protein [Pseudomaricurvus alcaniphilus]